MYGDAGRSSRPRCQQLPLPSRGRSPTCSSIFALLGRHCVSFSAAKMAISRSSWSSRSLCGPSLVSFSTMAISITRAARISQLGPSGCPNPTDSGMCVLQAADGMNPPTWTDLLHPWVYPSMGISVLPWILASVDGQETSLDGTTRLMAMVS